MAVEDETGFSLISPLKSTWAPRGQTPTVRTSLNHRERFNLLGGLVVSPDQRRIKLMVHSHARTLRGEEIIAWLKRLLRQVRGPIILVWDQHPIHRRRQVREFLAQHPRLQVYAFPTGAPELNPVEWVWQQINDRTASTAPHNQLELRANILAGVARVRRSPARLWAGFAGARLTR